MKNLHLCLPCSVVPHLYDLILLLFVYLFVTVDLYKNMYIYRGHFIKKKSKLFYELRRHTGTKSYRFKVSTLNKPTRSQIPISTFRTLQIWSEKMVRLSNNLLGILNVVVFVLSIPIFIAGVWLSYQASSECEKFLDKPMIVLGVFLMVVSLAGIVGACCRVSCLLWLYLCMMFFLIILIFCFTVFAFVVTNKGAGEAVSGRGYKEYKLGDYSHWL